MNVERSTVGTKEPRQPKRQKSLELVQSRQSLTTVRQEVLPTLLYYFLMSGSSGSLASVGDPAPSTWLARN